MSHLRLRVKSGFRLSTLAISIGLSLMSSCGFALEALDDDSLADSTGEGIAFLPENASIRLNGADTNNGGAGTYDTGYIRLIPVGPLTTESQDTNKDGVVNSSDQPVGKADIFLYGLAISQSNKNYGAARTSADWNGRFGRNIDSWGSAINPWVLKVATEKDVPNFSAISPTDTGKGDVSYLMLEAPLYHADTDNNFTNGINAGIENLSATEKSAYNLKLGLWGDIFVRDPKVAENMTATGSQFDLGGAGRANRLRLQAIWDGLSLNGSNIKLFQTLGGATNTNGMSTFYNNTLGISGLLRFNSGDGQTLRATSTSTAGSRTVEAYTTTWDGSKYGTAANYTDTSGTATGAASPNCAAGTTAHRSGSCTIQYQTRAVTDSASSSSWTPPALNNVLRFSTRETTNTNLLATPGINGGVAPVFDPNEGLYIYNLNVNLVLGSLYQPLTVGTDGQNITLELARIPNKESIYKKIYTAYPGATGNLTASQIAEYKGSTCNIYQCGTSSVAGYQGSNATHSSITIGSTVYNSATNTLEAYKGVEAVGISFGQLGSGSASTSAQTYRDVQQRTRGTSRDFWGTYSYDAWGGWSNLPVGSSAQYNLKAYSPNTWTQQAPLSEPAYVTPQSSVPSNNFGSAVIDGLLIQHMKITTKGL